ncbi:MAG: ATP-binding protein [Woeseiaceae bacterium]|nr:ATP-binding protein [Woeseiaceae bacterium]
MVGGGSDPRPGEISRAHNGVLFLDELPEFSRHVLEVLREPLETGQITISRAGAQADFPARFQLVAAMNPCPCGYLGDPQGECHCSADRVRNYRLRISGPLLDRIDLQIHVHRPSAEVMQARQPDGEPSREVRSRVAACRRAQLERGGVCNAQLDGDALRAACCLGEETEALLSRAMEHHALSARSYQRMLRVALTIADLKGKPGVDPVAMAEALSLKGLDAVVRPAPPQLGTSSTM